MKMTSMRLPFVIMWRKTFDEKEANLYQLKQNLVRVSMQLDDAMKNIREALKSKVHLHVGLSHPELRIQEVYDLPLKGITADSVCPDPLRIEARIGIYSEVQSKRFKEEPKVKHLFIENAVNQFSEMLRKQLEQTYKEGEQNVSNRF